MMRRFQTCHLVLVELRHAHDTQSIFVYKDFIIDICACLIRLIFIPSKNENAHSPLHSYMSSLVIPCPTQPISALSNKRRGA